MSGKMDRMLTLYLPLALYTGFTLFPFYWATNISLEKNGGLGLSGVHYLPTPFTLENFVQAWNGMGFYIYFRNSFLVAIVSMLFTVVFAVLTGYALSRYKFRGKTTFMLLLLSTQFIPGVMLLIPLFTIFQGMGLINNLFSLIIVNTIFQLPFTAIMMRGFISQIPFDLEESAMVDGCSRLKSMRLVLLPVLIPGIIAIAAFAFIGSWNQFEFALMFISKQNLFTVPIGLQYALGEFNINYGTLAAGSIIALIPVVLIFAYVQKYLVQGLSAGAVKG